MVEQLHESAVEALDQDGPVTMLNLMKFRPHSLDGDGSGWDAYGRYMEIALGLVKAREGLSPSLADAAGGPFDPAALSGRRG
jgi:hypothetical protein